MKSIKSNKFRLLFIFGLVFIAALLWRRHDLDGSSFWMDEIYQSDCTTRPVAEIWKKSPPDKPPLDYYIQAMFIGNKTDEFRARVHTAIIGAGIVALFGVWGLMLGGWRLASILVAITFSLPILMRYSQEGRPYSLFIFSEVLFFVVLWRMILGPKPVSWRWWTALAGAFALSMWSHYGALTACVTGLAVVLVWIIVSGRARSAAWAEIGNVKTALLLAALALAVAACWLPLHSRAAKAAAVDFGSMGYNVKDWWGAMSYLDIFSLGYDWYQQTHGGHMPLLALMLIGWIDWTRRRGDKALFANFCMLVFLANFAGMFLVYKLILNHWMEVRYTLGALPPAIMLAGIGIGSVIDGAAFGFGKFAGLAEEELAKIRNIALAFVCVAIICGYSAFVYYSPFRKTDYRGVAKMIRNSKAPPDLKIVGAERGAFVAMSHYMKRYGLGYEVIDAGFAPKKVKDCLSKYPNMIYVRTALGSGRKEYVRQIDQLPLRKHGRAYRFVDVRHSPNKTDVLAEPNINQEPCPMLLEGWSAPQQVGGEQVRAIAGAQSSMAFDCPASPRNAMVVAIAKPVAARLGQMNLKLSVNGADMETSTTLDNDWTLAYWKIDKSSLQAGRNVIELKTGASEAGKPSVWVRKLTVYKWDKPKIRR